MNDMNFSRNNKWLEMLSCMNNLFDSSEMMMNNNKPMIAYNNQNTTKKNTDVNKSINNFNKFNTNKSNAKSSEMRITDLIRKTVFRNPYTIIFWKNGTITKIKCNEADVYDPEKGLAMAIIKYYFGNRYYRDMLKILNNSEIISEPFERNKNKKNKKNKNTKVDTVETNETVNTEVESNKNTEDSKNIENKNKKSRKKPNNK